MSFAEKDPSHAQVARELGYSAKTHFEAKDYQRAAADAEAAYRLIPAPTLALLAARSQVELGQWNRAVILYRAAIAPTHLPKTTALVEAQQVATDELKQLEERMPLVRIHKPQSAQAGTVSIGALTIPEKTFGVWFPYDPGNHELIWRSEAGEEIRQNIRFEPGKRQELRVIVAPRSPARKREQAFGIAGLSTGAVGIGLGMGFGLAAQSQARSLSESCSGFVCPETEVESIRNYRRMRTVSTVSYIVGATGAVSGGFLLWRSSGEKESLNLTLSAAPQGLKLAGVF